jgi:hypothetical protein
VRSQESASRHAIMIARSFCFSSATVVAMAGAG